MLITIRKILKKSAAAARGKYCFLENVDSVGGIILRNDVHLAMWGNTLKRLAISEKRCIPCVKLRLLQQDLFFIRTF